jgi:hypothetical protein
MNPNDELILNFWASGKSGVSKRLAKRAWLILCENNRIEPKKITEVWGSASEAQEWIKNFHGMGLVGLTDQPRSGRSKKYAPVVQESIRSAKANKKIDWQVGLTNLSKQERESVWREARRTGSTLQRNRNGLNLPIRVPVDLSDIVGVFLSSKFQLIAILEDSYKRYQDTNGEWIQVEKSIIKSPSIQSGPPDLITALKIKFKRSQEDQFKFEQRRKKLEYKMTNQVIDKLSTLAAEFPRKVSLALVSDVRSGSELVCWLNLFRAKKIWTCIKKNNTSNFKEVLVIGHKGAPAAAMQHVFASLLPPNSENMGSLFDSITLKRTDPFCWYRTNDGDPEKDESNWLKSDLDFDRE